MDFIITKEQKSMQKAAREFLKAECGGDFVREMEKDDRGYTGKFWKKMAELDWMALFVPEAYDGVGGELMDLILLLEEMGRTCVPGPFFSTVVLGGTAILTCGSETQKREYLPKIADAEIVLTLAVSELETTKWDPHSIGVRATPEADSHIIDGVKLFVPDANSADVIVCATRTAGNKTDREGITLFMVDAGIPGLDIRPLKTIGGDKQFEVVFNGVEVSNDRILGGLGQGGSHLPQILNYAAVCKCAEMLGGAQRILEMSAAYAKERKQFGKAIGSFQSIQHHCANMLIDLEGSRFITYKAAWMLDNQIPCEKEVATAKAWVSEGYKRIAALGHQVQGGAAFMEEHDMPLFSRRAAAAAVTFGDAGYYREVVARSIGL